MAKIPDLPYRILIIGGSGSGKTNSLLDLINQQSDINNIYLYAKDSYEANYPFLINKRESFYWILKWYDIDDICKNIDEYNPDKKHRILILFTDVIAGILNNKNLIR